MPVSTGSLLLGILPICHRTCARGRCEHGLRRAQTKLDAGAFVDALHLLDILTSEQRQMPNARAVALAAHQALLQDSDNFWLSAWLKNQIKVLSDADT